MLRSFKDKLHQRKKSRAVSETLDKEVLQQLDSLELCLLCRELISQTILRRIDLVTSGAPYEHFADRFALLRSSCRLCRFAGSIKGDGVSNKGRVKWQSIYSLNPKSADYQNHTSRALLTFQTRYGLHDKNRCTGDGTYALLHPDFANDDLKPRHVKADSVDFALVKEWLQFCRDCHTATCCPTREEQALSLKVIDCQNRNVVDADLSFIYVALSYVWGTAAAIEEREGVFPTTIEDSITVALNLGYRYLWVDKYCISQVDDSERHHQISNMDKIYAAADLTILAAAGDNPDYGLPGVSARCRQEQKTLSLGSSTLVEIFDDRADIRKSSWASRAWTLQEGYLPRRRLIFTDHEVSFLCDNMYRQECIDQRLVSRGNGMWDGQDGSHLFGVIPNRNSYHFGQEQILHEYSGRKLSYSNDILNACLGILKAANVRHCGGIPLEMDPSSREVIMNLQWANENPGIHRPGFPTWSWTATTSVKVFPEIMQQPAMYNSTTVLIADDTWLTPYQWKKLSPNDGRHRSPKYIKITAPTGKPRFLSKSGLSKLLPDGIFYLQHTNDTTTGPGPFMVFETPGQHLTVYKLRLDVLSDFHLTRPEEAAQSLNGCVAVLLQPGSGMDPETGTFEVPRTYAIMLILRRCGDRYQRVGISDWNNEWNCEHIEKTSDPVTWAKNGWVPTYKRLDLEQQFKMETVIVE